MTNQQPLHIGILLGSARRNNNGQGLSAWVSSHIEKISPGCKVSIYDPVTPPLPLGPLTFDYMTMALSGEPTPDGTLEFPYDGENVRKWSKIVQSFDAIILLSPQYNWGIPGDLKVSLDHLYQEWVKMPFAAFTYGGRGGTKASTALTQVIHGLGGTAVSVETVLVKLPGDYISGDSRVTPQDEFLKEFAGVLDEELAKVVEAAKVRQKGKKDDIVAASEKAKTKAAQAKAAKSQPATV